MKARGTIACVLAAALATCLPAFAMAPASSPTLEQRLQRMEGELAIRRVLEDDFIREEGKWKILRRVDYPVMPTSEEWMKFIRERRAAQ